MKIEEIIQSMSLDEKAQLLTGIGGMKTAANEKYDIHYKQMADGPHGVRRKTEKNCIQFPNLCLLASTWDIQIAKKMGEALAFDCIEHDVDMLLGPGINIKRTPLCGRNFEYLSEDPVLAGEIAAGYINGLQENGVSASLKHFAANNQEKFRQDVSVEIDERTLREIYLKAFEIAVKKSKPESVMCSFNKINAVWCSENPFILSEILKDEWGYDGFVVSDWGSVQNIVKSVRAGLDMEMPSNPNIADELKAGLDNGEISMEQIDDAVRRVLKFALKEKPNNVIEYSREKQHLSAREIAASGIVLLKNKNNILPLNSDKYKKIAVIGEFAHKPLTCGQGSAYVHTGEEYIDSPLEELRKLLPDTEIEYKEIYKKREYLDDAIWGQLYSKEFEKFTSEADAVVVFIGSMESEDTEMLDRRSIELNPNYVLTIEFAMQHNKNVIVVMQTGSAVVLGDWHKRASAVVEMWLGGESAGSAIAEILCGKTNPSGKLSETFPNRLRIDMQHQSERYNIDYSEKLDVGYRYYDKHPEEIVYPFGHGLSYTEFMYKDLEIVRIDDAYKVEFKLKNIGSCDGSEVVQLYVSDLMPTVIKPIKELKMFKKVHLKQGEETNVSFILKKDAFEYYNVILHKWIAESGVYNILIGSSSRDIRLEGEILFEGDTLYSTTKINADSIGDAH